MSTHDVAVLKAQLQILIDDYQRTRKAVGVFIMGAVFPFGAYVVHHISTAGIHQ